MHNMITIPKTQTFDNKLLALISGGRSMHLWTITPEMAASMMEWNDRNRPLSKGVVKKYAAQMTDGRFPFTGQPILFSPERLIDGQHRLQACIDSGMSFEATVVFGVPDDSFAFVDINKVRSAANIFSIHGVQNAALMAAATILVAAYDANRLGSATNISRKAARDHAELYEIYCKYGNLQDSAWIGHLFASNRIAPPSTMIALHFICARKCRKDADAFFRSIGEAYGFKGKKDPAYKLHKKLSENAISHQKLSRLQVIAFTIKAWNAFRANRDVGVIRFNAGETMPRVR